MAHKSYCAQVLGALRRVTSEEKLAIAQELNAHIEDHVCALEEIGYSHEEALEKAETAMGDPEEMARELDRQYPMGWLILKRAAITLTVLLCCAVFLNSGMFYFLFKSTALRLNPTYDSPRSSDFTPTVFEETDLRMQVDSDVVRIHQVSTGTLRGVPTAEVSICIYDRFPGGVISSALQNTLTLRSTDGQRHNSFMGGTSNWFTAQGSLFLPLEPGDEEVILEYSQFDDTYTLTIPLPKEGDT